MPASEVQKHIADLSKLLKLMLTPYQTRYYFDGDIAPHLIGYVNQIQQKQEEEYLRRDYSIDERVKQTGLEK